MKQRKKSKRRKNPKPKTGAYYSELIEPNLIANYELLDFPIESNYYRGEQNDEFILKPHSFYHKDLDPLIERSLNFRKITVSKERFDEFLGPYNSYKEASIVMSKLSELFK